MQPPNIENGGTGNKTEALDAVYQICQLPFCRDSHPNVHATPQVVNYVADINAGFCDRNIYVSAMAKYLEEAAIETKMAEQMHTGDEFASMLYTWRSCSMSLGQLKDPNNNAAEMHQKILDVLQPEIQRLRDFMAFQRVAVETLENEVKRLCQQKAEFVSEAHLLSIGKYISMLATLDELKIAKASVRNDFSYFKRVSDQLHRDPAAVTEMHDISMFLATHNVILTQVKSNLSRIAGSDDVLCNIVSTCASWYEQKLYLLPEQKYNLVKVIGFLLYLLDGDKVNINKMKQLNLAKLDNILKEVEVVPLFGDIVISPFNFIKKTHSFDAQHWPRCLDETSSQQSGIVTRMAGYRQQLVEVLCELTQQTEQHRKVLQQVKAKKKLEEDSVSPEQASVLYNIAVKCLRILSTWTCTIAELFSWKLLHPAEVPAEVTAEIYERATRYNYSPEEKNALTELIGMVKSVQGFVLNLEPLLSRGIYTYIYLQLQEFVQFALSEPLRKAEKHHKDIIRSTLVAVKDISIDIAALANKEPISSPAATKKKAKAEDCSVQILSKAVRPSMTQLYLIRSMLESLIEKGDKSTNRRSPRKDIDVDHVRTMEKFLQSSFLWSQMMNLHGAVQSCSDLSQLWFREFYLEMTKGERIQFPIEMSMPWILMSHILESKDPYLIQHILYPLDLYNDSAQCAIQCFHKQFLYDEIDAEVNLCFEQFIYKLSEQIYEYYKTRAALIMLDRGFRSECVRQKVVVTGIRTMNYACLMQQTNLQIMGRTVSLRQLITQHINTCLLRSLDVAISRFETFGFPGIVELAGLIQLNRETHKMLSRHLHLDEFNMLFSEANHNVTSPYGRISLYILLELNSQFLPHYCYNGVTGRFVETVLPFAEVVKRDKPSATAHYNLWGTKELATYYTVINGRYQKFVGEPHFRAMVEVMGYQDVAMILKEILEIIKNLVGSTLVKYLKGLQEVMPKRLKLPRYEYTSSGALGYFQAQLTDILAYTELQPKVFQCIREIGNAVIFALHLEQALCVKEANELVTAGLFQHNIPIPYVPSKEGPDAKQQEIKQRQAALEALDKKYRNQFVQDIISKKGSEEQVQIVRDIGLITKEKLSAGLSIYSSWLRNVRSALGSDAIWLSQNASNGCWNVEVNTEFHQIWSAMQFMFCRPAGPNEYTVESLFGEGLNWAGCLIMVLLGQQRRFEAMDFSYHLQRIHRVDQQNKQCDGIDLRKMVDRIRKFQLLNDQIFEVLNKYLSNGQGSMMHDFGVVVEHFTPMTQNSVAV